MIRIFLFVVAVGFFLLAAGVVYLGMYPPAPAPHAIEKVVPNDRFTTH
jgi:hypothetical protein